ncbi:MAG: DNA polymerase I [Phycisphaerales bacterium]|nr:DNA polymerase I [Phycisphaerales bacterium]
MKTLYVIDGYAQFFRAYHAIRTPMTSPVTKEPTNMTFGFVGMLLKLLRGEGKMGCPPDYLAVAIDVSGDRGTFRSHMYPDYKANRPEPPDDLKPQVQRALALLKAIGVPVLGAEGFEADDVIATIATRLAEDHPQVRLRIVSKDKDLKQLLREGSAGAPERQSGEAERARSESMGSEPPAQARGCMAQTGSPVELYDVHTDELITVEALHRDTGIGPSQVIDMLALMGDTVDNVPGAEGVGPKTAAQLISEFGSLDAVLAEVLADKPAKEWKIKGKRREKIAEAAPRLPLSRELVTLRHDVPVEFDLVAAARESIRLEALLPILKELGFNRYQEEVKALLGLGEPAGDPSTVAREANALVHMPRRQSGGTIQSAGGTGTLPEKPEPGGLFDATGTVVSNAAPVAVDGHYRCVQTTADLAELVAELRACDLFAVDTETTGVRPMWAELCGLSFSTRPGTGWYVPVRAPTGSVILPQAEVLDALRPMLEDASIAKVGHNLKFDMLVLRKVGVRLAGHLPVGARPGAGDTMIASYLIDASRSSHSMDALALALLKRQNIPLSDLIGTGKSQRTFDCVDLERATNYAAEDADVTLRLAHLMLPQLKVMGLAELYRDLEMPLVDVLAELEYNGVLVDPDELERQRGKLETRIVELKREIADAAMEEVGRGFDPDSPRQLGAILFNPRDAAEPGLGLKPIKKTKTGFSTDAEVLDKLVQDAGITSPIPELILEYRQLTKLVSTYLVSLREEIHPQTHRIHASFNQTVAATGRLSSSDPNLQNIPIRTDLGREIRRAFIAPPGRVLITADYSQIELRLLAHLSRDPALIEAFQAGEDIHAAVAAQIHGVPLAEVTKQQRHGAKMVNFGIVYGITAFGLARRLGCEQAEAARIIDDYKRRFAGITTFLEECIQQARRKGYVATMLQRRRPIADIESNNPTRRALAERVAINSVVQGSAADLIKLAMVDIQRRIDASNAACDAPSQGGPACHAGGYGDLADPALVGVKMLIQIHDELVFEAPTATAEAARAIIVDRMQKAMALRVPLIADSAISSNWYEGK